MGHKVRYKRKPIPQMVSAPLIVQASEPEWMPTLGMNRYVAEARQDMGEARWQKLMKEWDNA